MKFCVNCGKQVADDAKFCANCGSAIATANEMQAPPAEPAPAPAPDPIPAPPVQPIAPVAPPPASAPASGKKMSTPMLIAIAAVVSVFVMPGISLLVAAAGIFFGYKEMKETGNKLPLIISVAAVALSIIITILGVGLFGLVFLLLFMTG